MKKVVGIITQEESKVKTIFDNFMGKRQALYGYLWIPALQTYVNNDVDEYVIDKDLPPQLKTRAINYFCVNKRWVEL